MLIPQNRFLLCPLIILFWFSLPVFSASKNDAAEYAQTCREQMLKDEQSALEFNMACADFYSYLQHQGLLDVLATPLPAHLNASQLKFLYISSIMPASREIDVRGLDRLLEKILRNSKTEPVLSWWDRFIAWLKGVKSEKYANEYNWLINFLETITPSEHVLRNMIYGLFVVVALLAAGLVIQELYLAGVFSRKRKINSKREQRVGIDSMPIRATPSLKAINRLTPAQQITALLNSVIDILKQRQALPPNPALTNQQLTNFLHQNHHPSEADFAYLVEFTEPVLYGNTLPSEQALTSCWRKAKNILAAPIA